MRIDHRVIKLGPNRSQTFVVEDTDRKEDSSRLGEMGISCTHAARVEICAVEWVTNGNPQLASAN